MVETQLTRLVSCCCVIVAVRYIVLADGGCQLVYLRLSWNSFSSVFQSFRKFPLTSSYHASALNWFSYESVKLSFTTFVWHRAKKQWGKWTWWYSAPSFKGVYVHAKYDSHIAYKYDERSLIPLLLNTVNWNRLCFITLTNDALTIFPVYLLSHLRHHRWYAFRWVHT